MVHLTKEQLDEMLADCASEAMDEWLDICTNEELAVLVCVWGVHGGLLRAKVQEERLLVAPRAFLTPRGAGSSFPRKEPGA